ncbi:MAG: ubiquinol oxidase subunit II [Burkholderiaceae bacterium]
MNFPEPDSEAADKRPGHTGFRVQRCWLERVGLASACLVVMALSACSSELHLSFLDPQGPIASKQRWHFYEVLAVLLVLVAVPVFVLTPFFLWRYRYGAKTARDTPQWNYNGWLEIASWGGPVVIVLVIAFFVWRDTHALDPFKPLASDQAPLRVQAIGFDWKWLFIYPDQGIASVGMLALPVGRPLAFEITSATVMQSLFIPSLGSQIYAMGGMVTQLHLLADKPGRSLGENTMYNGDGFHQQKFTAMAMSPREFEAWAGKVRAGGVALNSAGLQTLAQRGTRAELVAALTQGDLAKSQDGNVYFSGVTPALFSAVVQATKDGTALAAAGVATQSTSGAAATAAAPALAAAPAQSAAKGKAP